MIQLINPVKLIFSIVTLLIILHLDIYIAIYVEWHNEVNKIEQNIFITNCVFANNFIGKSILSFSSRSENMINAEGAIIINSKFLFNTCKSNTDIVRITSSNCALVISDTNLQLRGPIIIYNNTCNYLLIGSFLMFHNYIEFSQNNGRNMINAYYILLVQEVVLNITNNDILVFFLNNRSDIDAIIPDIPLCYFQFYGNRANIIKQPLEVVIRNNNYFKILNEDIEYVNCRFAPTSEFHKENPLQVYQQFIHCHNDRGPFSCPFTTGAICDCSKDKEHICYTNTLGPIFPGQTSIIHLYIDNKFIAEDINNNVIQTIPISIDIYSGYLTESQCKVLSSNQILNWITRNCRGFNSLDYIIKQ